MATAYITAAAIKAVLGITDATRDTYLTTVCAAASEAVEQHCHRSFGLDTEASARTMRVHRNVVDDDDGQRLLLGADIGSATDLVVETGTASTSWTAITTDVELSPLDALAKDWPATSLLYVGGSWPAGGGQRIRVTARWGWPAVPASVTQAATILATRYFKRKDSAEGMVGSAEWGMVRISRVDPDVEALLNPYRIPVA